MCENLDLKYWCHHYVITRGVNIESAGRDGEGKPIS